MIFSYNQSVNWSLYSQFNENTLQNTHLATSQSETGESTQDSLLKQSTPHLRRQDTGQRGRGGMHKKESIFDDMLRNKQIMDKTVLFQKKKETPKVEIESEKQRIKNDLSKLDINLNAIKKQKEQQEEMEKSRKQEIRKKEMIVQEQLKNQMQVEQEQAEGVDMNQIQSILNDKELLDIPPKHNTRIPEVPVSNLAEKQNQLKKQLNQIDEEFQKNHKYQKTVMKHKDIKYEQLNLILPHFRSNIDSQFGLPQNKSNEVNTFKDKLASIVKGDFQNKLTTIEAHAK